MLQTESRTTIAPDNAVEAACPSQPARHLLSIIRRYSRTKGFCYGGQKWLAEQMGCCERTVRTCLRELESLELIETKRAWFEGRNRNTYRPLQPANFAGHFAGSKRQDLPVGAADFAGSTYETGTEEENNNKAVVVADEKSAEEQGEVPPPAAPAAAGPRVEQLATELMGYGVSPKAARQAVSTLQPDLVRACIRYWKATAAGKDNPPGWLVTLLTQPLDHGIQQTPTGWKPPGQNANVRDDGEAELAKTADFLRAARERRARLQGGSH